MCKCYSVKCRENTFLIFKRDVDGKLHLTEEKIDTEQGIREYVAKMNAAAQEGVIFEYDAQDRDDDWY